MTEKVDLALFKVNTHTVSGMPEKSTNPIKKIEISIGNELCAKNLNDNPLSVSLNKPSKEGEIKEIDPKLAEYGIDLNKPFEITEDMIKKMKNKGKKGFWESLKDGAKNAIPFISGAMEIKKSVELLAIAKKQENGEKLTKEETEKLYLYLLEQVESEYRESSFMGKVGEMMSHLPAFAGEFAVTGGLYSAGNKVALKASQKILGHVVKKQIGKTFIKKASAVAVGSAFRTVALSNTYAGIAQRRLELDTSNMKEETLEDGTKITTGKLNIKTADESFSTSVAKGLADGYIEALSEQSGQALISPMSKIPVFGKFLVPPKGSQKFLNKIGYHGLLEEYAEERFGGLLRGATVLDKSADKDYWSNLVDSTIPTWEQTGVELTTTALWGGAMTGSHKVFKKSTKKLQNINLASKISNITGEPISPDEFNFTKDIIKCNAHDIKNIDILNKRIKSISYVDKTTILDIVGIANLFDVEYQTRLAKICNTVEAMQAGILTENSFRYLTKHIDDLQLFATLLKNRNYNNAPIAQEIIQEIIKSIKKHPEFEQNLIDISDFVYGFQNCENIVALWQKHPNEIDTIKKLILIGKDIQQIENIIPLLATSEREAVLEIVLSKKIQFKNIEELQAIIQLKKAHKNIATYIQEYLANRKTDTSFEDGNKFIDFVKRNYKYRDDIFKMIKNPNMTVLTMPEVFALKTEYKDNSKMQKLISYLSTDGKFDLLTIKQILNDIKMYPEIADIIFTNKTVIDFIDTNKENSSSPERNNARTFVEKMAYPNNILLLKNILGSYYDKLKWENMIDLKMTESQINEVINDLIEKSSSFVRIGFIEKNYGKNPTWASCVQKIIKIAVLRLQKGESLRDILNSIATNYQNESRSHNDDFNGTGTRRELDKSGSYLITGYDNSTYSEYKDRFDKIFQQYQMDKKSPFTDIKITQIDWAHQMIHPSHDNGHNTEKTLQHCNSYYIKIQSLIKKVQSGEKLTLDEIKSAKENIAAIHFLIANVIPYVRGSAGITDCLTRSFYKALGEKVPIIKKGVGLDLEAFARNLDDYQANWDTYFEKY